MSTVDTTNWELIQALTKDMRQASRLLGQREVRALTDAYYQIQNARITAAAQARSAATGESNTVSEWMTAQLQRLENNLNRALGDFSAEYAVGNWMLSICGIGPVISAGMLAHLDIRKAPTWGHFTRFAGLDPTLVWKKKTKRPYNARLKVLCAFKAGECFVKVQNNKKDHYGKLYRERRDKEDPINESGGFAEQAAEALEKKNYRKDKDAYKAYSSGKLPPAQMHARARRYCVKIFLSHLHEVMYMDYYGKRPPVPYVFSEHCGEDHRHYIEVPNLDKAVGAPLKELYAKTPDKPKE